MIIGDSDYQSDVNYASDPYMPILFRSPGLGKRGFRIPVRRELRLRSLHAYSV
jgi:hypothetical protein